MRIRSLRLDDFGVFDGARMDDIEGDVVVIGGPQRAGKTTLLQAFRQLRGGVSRNGSLPPATDTYRIDAHVDVDGDQYRYALHGHADPRVSPLDGADERIADDLFGPVTRRQYRQLFTISLDELRRLPPGIDDSEDLARVLLGGAYGDIAEIPELQSNFADAAATIGLSKGRPTAKTGQFHGPYRQIQSGIEKRREANKQVKEHDAVKRELEETRAQLSNVRSEIEDLNAERDRLNVLQSEFDDIQRLQRLRSDLTGADVEAAEAFPAEQIRRAEQLRSEFTEAVESYSAALSAFENEVDVDDAEDYRAVLLDHASELASLEQAISGWEARIEALRVRNSELDERRTELESAVSTLHPEWGPSVSHLFDVETSKLSEDRVTSAADEYVAVRTRLESKREELEQVRHHLDGLTGELDDLRDEVDERTGANNAGLRNAAIVAGVAVIAGLVGTATVSVLVGAAAGFLVLALGLYTVRNSLTVSANADTAPIRELRSQVTSRRADRDGLQETVEDLDDDVSAAEADLAAVRETLGLPAGVSADGLVEFYRRVVDLKQDAHRLEREEKQYRDARDELEATLREAAGTVASVRTFSWDDDAPLEYVDGLIAAVRTASSHLELARAVAEAGRTRARTVTEIQDVLGSWQGGGGLSEDAADDAVRESLTAFIAAGESAAETMATVEERDALEQHLASRFEAEATREAFAPLRGKSEPWLDVLELAAGEFVDGDALGHRLDEIADRLDTLTDRTAELDEQRIEYTRRLDALASDDDLIAAQRQIDAARVELERLGERYAVNRIAESMLDRLHDRFMAEVVDWLVDDAGDVFSAITGEYTGIELSGDLHDLQFRALRNGKPAHGVGELSRATAEQLFLAVRIARIRNTDATPPVVLDDAMTNFDPEHSLRMLRALDELSALNQVFFLTCHPEFVELAADALTAPQYWYVDDSRFEGPIDAPTLASSLGA